MNETALLAFRMLREDMLLAGADTLYSTITPPSRRTFALAMAVISTTVANASTTLTTADSNADRTGRVSTCSRVRPICMRCVSTAVGTLLGCEVGLLLGDAEGDADGCDVGCMVGVLLGGLVG